MPLSAGTLYLDVKPDTANVTSKSGGLATAMKTAGVVAAGAFALSFAKGAMAESKEAEKVGLMFADSIARGTENFNGDKLLATFDKINNAMGISDEDLQKWSAQLNNAIDFEQFGKNSEKMMVDMTKLIPNLAAQSGKSSTMVAKAIKTIGTAPESAVAAVRKLGGLTDEQAAHAEKLIKQGKVQAAQQYIVKRATEASAGAAAKQTTASEKLSITWAELQETVGTKLLPMFNSLADKATQFITWITSGSTGAKVFIGTVLALVGALVAFKTITVATTIVTNAAAAAVKIWNAAVVVARNVQMAWNLAMAANPIGLIVIAVIALIALIVVLWKKNETFRKIVLAAWNAIKVAAVALWNGIKRAVTAFWNWIKPFVMSYITILKAYFKILWTTAKVIWSGIKAVFKSGWDAIKQVFSTAKSIFQKVWDPLESAAKAVFNAIASAWNNTVGRLSFHVPDWVPKLGGSGWDVPDIPMLADGGIVTRPTLAVVGEAGPEAVIPLGGGGSGGMNVRIVDSNLGLVMDGILQGDKRYNEGRGRANR